MATEISAVDKRCSRKPVASLSSVILIDVVV